MKISWKKIVSNLVAVLLLVGFGYFYRDGLRYLYLNIQRRIAPCQQPITYSIAELDPQFGISKAELLADIAQAEKIWEAPLGRQLFTYSPDGELKIRLVYDYRQKATVAMQKLGLVINGDRSTYDAVKVKYDSLVVAYDQEKSQVNTLIEDYNTQKSALERDVNYWNSRGGASKAVYDLLQQRQLDLNSQFVAVSQAQEALNKSGDIVNSTALVLNKLISELNLQVAQYNTVGASTGKEFNQGEYLSNMDGTFINIFQFNDENKLVRVLAHEFGHALGLEHIDNSKAIMYYLNEGSNEKLTADDLVALKKKCGQ